MQGEESGRQHRGGQRREGVAGDEYQGRRRQDQQGGASAVEGGALPGCGQIGAAHDRRQGQEGDGPDGEGGPPGGRARDGRAEQGSDRAQCPEARRDDPHAADRARQAHRRGDQARAARRLGRPARHGQGQPGRHGDDGGAGDDQGRAQAEGGAEAAAAQQARHQRCADGHGPGEDGDEPGRGGCTMPSEPAMSERIRTGLLALAATGVASNASHMAGTWRGAAVAGACVRAAGWGRRRASRDMAGSRRRRGRRGGLGKPEGQEGGRPGERLRPW
ncbi:hypothetical protein STANM309S_04536 [Streptomyces tanashiensis]